MWVKKLLAMLVLLCSAFSWGFSLPEQTSAVSSESVALEPSLDSFFAGDKPPTVEQWARAKATWSRFKTSLQNHLADDKALKQEWQTYRDATMSWLPKLGVFAESLPEFGTRLDAWTVQWTESNKAGESLNASLVSELTTARQAKDNATIVNWILGGVTVSSVSLLIWSISTRQVLNGH